LYSGKNGDNHQEEIVTERGIRLAKDDKKEEAWEVFSE
jgi:hypothetical protein